MTRDLRVFEPVKVILIILYATIDTVGEGLTGEEVCCSLGCSYNFVFRERRRQEDGFFKVLTYLTGKKLESFATIKPV